jgi:hypothetical protein
MPTIGKLAPLDRFDKEEHLGHVLVFVNPIAEEGDFGFGETVSAVCDVICINDTKAWPGARIFGTQLVPRLLSGDKIVPAVLVQGTARAGRAAPWLFEEVSDDEQADAQAVVDRVVTQLGSGKLVVDFGAFNSGAAFG